MINLNLLNRIYTYLICAYIILLPFSDEQHKIKGMSFPGDVLLALLIIFYLLLLICSKEERVCFVKFIKDFFIDKTSLSIFLLFIVMAVSVTYASDKKLAVSETTRFLSYMCLFFIIKYKVSSSEEYHMLINSYLLTSILLCLFGIYQFFTGAGLNEKFIIKYDYGVNIKIASTLSNPNNFAAYLLLCVFPVFMLFIYEKQKKYKLIYLLIFILTTVNIVLTFSRNVLIGFGIGILVLILIYSKKLLAVFVPLVASALCIPQIRIRISEVGESSLNISRIKLWKTALLMFRDHPVFGVGNGNYAAEYNTYVYRYPQLYCGFKTYPAHNTYLKILSELGIVGEIVFITMIIFLVLRLYKFIKNSDDMYFKHFYTGFFASVLAFLFMNISDNFFFVPKTTTYFWMIVSVFMGLCYKSADLKDKLYSN